MFIAYEALASGVHPATDFEGNALTGKRAVMAGKPIAGGATLCKNMYTYIAYTHMFA